MLKLCYCMQELNFPALMDVYSEANRKNGAENWPDVPEGVQLLLAEQEFRQYLREVFFVVPGAVYTVWEDKGKYVSALRLEPYRDGLLLAGLETAPEFRRLGYAGALICETLKSFPGKKIYSHIHKGNTVSIAVHERCGFRRILNHGVYLDGSVTQRAATYLYEHAK